MKDWADWEKKIEEGDGQMYHDYKAKHGGLRIWVHTTGRLKFLGQLMSEKRAENQGPVVKKASGS
eukprot:3139108-Amphidinium_carterae.1